MHNLLGHRHITTTQIYAGDEHGVDLVKPSDMCLAAGQSKNCVTAQAWAVGVLLLLEAAGEGAIMAGTVGTTLPMLDGGEWTHFLGESHTAARTGHGAFCGRIAGAGKGEANWLRRE